MLKTTENLILILLSTKKKLKLDQKHQRYVLILFDIQTMQKLLQYYYNIVQKV